MTELRPVLEPPRRLVDRPAAWRPQRPERPERPLRRVLQLVGRGA